MQLARRVRQWHVRRLYNLSKLGIYDDELLLEVGWGLFARCEDILTVVRAVEGEVPCPQCGEIVYRAKYYRTLKWKESRSAMPRFSCPQCSQLLTWLDCREALRERPRCFKCLVSLDWNNVEDMLSCRSCEKTWSWKQYRESIKNRVRLPCVHCGEVVARPAQPRRRRRWIESRNETSSSLEELPCPSCGEPGVHIGGKFQCSECRIEKPWSTYRERLKQRAEHLNCEACGYKFTWKSWRRQYQGQFLLTGNPVPVQEFLQNWPRCLTSQDQLIQIDILLYALHGAGVLAPLFIEGNEKTVKVLLDELALV